MRSFMRICDLLRAKKKKKRAIHSSFTKPMLRRGLSSGDRACLPPVPTEIFWMIAVIRGRPTEGGGGQGIPPRGPMRLYFHDFYIMSCIFTLFLYLSHCLDSMSERLGRIITNAFTVSVDKLFDACKRLSNRRS